jgi:hypothetical protein
MRLSCLIPSVRTRTTRVSDEKRNAVEEDPVVQSLPPSTATHHPNCAERQRLSAVMPSRTRLKTGMFKGLEAADMSAIGAYYAALR